MNIDSTSVAAGLWPWPLAPLFIALLVSVAAAVVFVVYRQIIGPGYFMSGKLDRLTVLPVERISRRWRPFNYLLLEPWRPLEGARRLPILPRFGVDILPALVILWLGLIGGYVVTGRDYLWTLLPWATVTTIMLWPVGRALGRPYLSYRSVGFIIGVISMAYIPLAGFALTAPLSFGWKSVIFFGMVVDLTVLGILPGLRWFIGQPVGMFFRPDLLFGDGRVLATGILSLVLGLRYIIGSPAMGVPWPLPNWDWYAILFAIVAGLIPMIAVRGLLKLVMRMRRLRDGAWTGWGAILVREGFLVVTMLSVGYGFHHAFMGRPPFTEPILTSDPDFWPALAITVAGAAILILGRGAYKKHIGDPFILETVLQSFVKQILLVIGAVVLFYGFMSLLHMGPMARQMGINGLRTWDNSARVWQIGLPFFFWGVLMLVPIRILIQHYQRHAIVAQMAAVIVPNQAPHHAKDLLRRLMLGMLRMDGPRRVAYLVTMNQALATADPDVREVMTQTMVWVLAELPEGLRDVMMDSQAAALARIAREYRVTRMGDMMAAVSALPEEDRGVLMRKMSSLLG